MRKAAIVIAIATVVAVAGCNRLPGSSVEAGKAPPLAMDKPLSGEITARSALNYNDGSHYQVYALALQDKQRVGIKLTGTLNGSISVFDNGTLVASSRSGYESGDEVSVAFRADGSGTYQVAVNAEGPDAFGPFRLRAETLQPYDGTPIVGAGRIDDLLLDETQDYTLKVDSPGLYEIQLRSDAFDTLLSLKGNGQESENDDGGEGTDSRITLPLQPGEYTLTVRGLGDGDQGAFSLEATRSAMPDNLVDTDGTTLPRNGSVYTLLEGEGRRRFLLTLDEPAEVQLDALSSQVDTVLRLVGGEIERSDDDGGNGTDAHLQETLPAGHYTVDVSNLSETSGLVEIKVR